MQSTSFHVVLVASPLAFITLALPAAAQPAGLNHPPPASSGATNVAQEGFQAAAAPPADSKDASSLKVLAGGLWTAGNSRTLALTAGVDYRLRRGDNQFGALAAANYGRSAPDADSDTETTVENYQGRLRYDRFVSDTLAAFLSVSARRDRFQGLDLRLNIDPGLAYYFIDEATHRFWAELGYDLQHDIRRSELVDAAAADPAVPDIADSETRHNARVFVGYDNQINAVLKFATSVEYIQGLQDTENWRLNWDGALTSQIGEKFSVATTLAVKYDNNPLPGVEDTDVITALNLVYTFE